MLPRLPSVPSDRGRTTPEPRLSLAGAVELTRTGDLWLFRGSSAADRAIRVTTNSPVNHVGMAVVLDDLPPLMWHAELGRSLPDVWTGEHQRGVQLHKLADAVTTWKRRYGQRGWVRQLEGTIEREHEDRLMEVIQQHDGRAFPTTLGLAGQWAKGRVRRRPQQSLEAIYCAELLATTYQAMGLLPSKRPASWYDPGRFWSGDHLELVPPFRLGGEIAVSVPDASEEESAEAAPDASRPEPSAPQRRGRPRLRLPQRPRRPAQ